VSLLLVLLGFAMLWEQLFESDIACQPRCIVCIFWMDWYEKEDKCVHQFVEKLNFAIGMTPRKDPISVFGYRHNASSCGFSRHMD